MSDSPIQAGKYPAREVGQPEVRPILTAMPATICIAVCRRRDTSTSGEFELPGRSVTADSARNWGWPSGASFSHKKRGCNELIKE